MGRIDCQTLVSDDKVAVLYFVARRWKSRLGLWKSNHLSHELEFLPPDTTIYLSELFLRSYQQSGFPYELCADLGRSWTNGEALRRVARNLGFVPHWQKWNRSNIITYRGGPFPRPPQNGCRQSKIRYVLCGADVVKFIHYIGYCCAE